MPRIEGARAVTHADSYGLLASNKAIALESAENSSSGEMGAVTRGLDRSRRCSVARRYRFLVSVYELEYGSKSRRSPNNDLSFP